MDRIPIIGSSLLTSAQDTFGLVHLKVNQLDVLKSLKFTAFNFRILLIIGSIFLTINFISIEGVIISPVINVLISTYIYLQINVPILNSTTA